MSDPEDPAEAAVASYTARSAEFYRVLATDAIDGDDEALATWAHSIVSKAAESEAFESQKSVDKDADPR